LKLFRPHIGISLVKERLTGAIILVVLIVLLVPELLSGPSRPAPAPQAAATSSEEPPLRSYTIDLMDEAHPAGSGSSATNPSPQASGPTQPPTIVEPPPAGSQPPQTAASAPAASQAQDGQAQGATAEEVPQPRAPSSGTASPRHGPDVIAAQPRSPRQPPPRADTPVAGGWAVQLGVFARHENADRLVQELKGQGFHALVSESSGGGGRTLWRVRAGPLAERAAAEQLSAKLRAAGHPGSVVPK
jgi:DedD protein